MQRALRNDGSDKPEITEADIARMRTDGWTQAQYRQHRIPFVLTNRSNGTSAYTATPTAIKQRRSSMYVIEIKNEEGKVIERIEMPTSGPNGYSMTTIEREVTEHLYDLIEGYTLSITLEA